MSVAAVQQYVQAQLLGSTLNQLYYPQRELDAQVTPPAPGFLEKPTVFIWGAHTIEKRRTLGRGYGFKKLVHDLRLYVISLEDGDSPYLDVAFPSVLELVQTTLRAAPIPADLSDPTTGAASHILAIGEQFEVNYDSVRTVQDQRMLRFLALITAKVEESLLA